MIYPFALLQSWEQLSFKLPEDEDLFQFPWSLPVAAVILILLTILLWKARRNYKALPELAKMPDSSETPDVTVIIPARNEAGQIANCLKSFPGVPVVVVNDDSSDKTAEVAANAGAKVVQAPAVRAEMLGKPNALVAGAAGLKTAYLFFTDADARFSKAFLASAVQHAKRTETVLVTALLGADCRGLFAKMLVPYFQALFFTGINGKAVNQTLAKDILVGGQCLLFERQPYEFFGGHRPVIQSVLDDVEIAAVVKRHRMRSAVMRAEELGTVRYPTTLGSLWRWLQRVSYPLVFRQGKTAAQVLFTSFLLFTIAPVGAWLAWEQQYPALAVFLLWPMLLLKPWYRGWLGVLFYIPAVYLYSCIALHSTLTALVGLEVRWRGRRV